MTHEVSLTVNGQRRSAWVESRRTLADMLRRDLALTGTHLGCEQGVCGSCSVLVDGTSARSCLMLAVQAHGSSVVTIEGLAGDHGLSVLQSALRDSHAFQCGFCTPGLVIMAAELLRENPQPTEQEVREAISANLCRCTGYESIIRGIVAAAERER